MRFKHEHTDKFCGTDCNNPPELPYALQIDLKDGIDIRLKQNPSKLLKDKELNHYFFLCELAKGGLFPSAGGAYDQETEFLQFYRIYLQWMELADQIRQARLPTE